MAEYRLTLTIQMTRAEQATFREGGSWVTNDGSTPGKNIARWEPCRPCGGKGTV